VVTASPTFAPTASGSPSPYVTFTPSPGGDLDNDGVVNSEDNCPYIPNGPAQENVPGVGNQTDSDGDAVPGLGTQPGGDACDQDDDNDDWPDYYDLICRIRPEDHDDFEDNDGCPDADNDSDGVCDEGQTAVYCTGSDAGRVAFYAAGHGHSADVIDCRNLPEDRDAFHDGDGCPEPDNDNDGFPDLDDRCDGNDNLAGEDGVLGSGEDDDHDGILDPGEDTIIVDGRLTSDDSAQTGEDFDGVLDIDGCFDAIWGDVDCGGSVNSIDALRILRLSVGLPGNAPAGCASSADVNCDGITNAIDALKLLLFASGFRETAAAGCLTIGR
jgi:hypothetical protein